MSEEKKEIKIAKMMASISEAVERLLSEAFGEQMKLAMIVWPRASGMQASMVAGNAAPEEMRIVLESALKALPEPPFTSPENPSNSDEGGGTPHMH